MKGINKKALINGLKQMNSQEKQELKQILQEILSPEAEATSVFITVPNFGNSSFYALAGKIVVQSGTGKWTINLNDF